MTNKTKFLDKNYNEIYINSILLFDNGSRYIVKMIKKQVVIKHIDNPEIPSLILSRVSYGNILSNALMI